MDNWISIKNLPHKKCFGCGPANDIGLKLEFKSNQEVVKTETVIPARLAGWANLTHGGITATVLDETMAWTVIYFKRCFMLTKSMKVDFIRPIFVGDKIRCEGRIAKEISPKEVIIKAEIFNEAGELVARSEGSMALYDGVSIRKFGFLDEDFLTEFEEIVLKQ
ncbi:MAG: PaaI family thioesterase [Leptospira sp.]|nr:PaaI family thioesterase [Leptospira sp.]